MNKWKAIFLAAAMAVPMAACSAQQPAKESSDEKSSAAENVNAAESNRETVYQVALLQ